MDAPCNCCSSLRQWVRDHLNFDPHAPGIRPERWGDRRWLAYARECQQFWFEQKEPLEIDDDVLARAMREAYLD